MIIVLGARTESYVGQNPEKIVPSSASCYACDSPATANMLMNRKKQLMEQPLMKVFIC